MNKPDGTTNLELLIIESGQHNPDSRPEGTTIPTVASPSHTDKGLSAETLIRRFEPSQPLIVLTNLSSTRGHSGRTIVPHPPVPPPQTQDMRLRSPIPTNPLYPRWRTTVRFRGRASGHTAHNNDGRNAGHERGRLTQPPEAPATF